MIGASPIDEDCAQVGTPDYKERASKELYAFKAQLRRHYQAHFGVAYPGRLLVVSNPHDFGTYYELGAIVDESRPAEVEAAYWLEGNTPARWDAEAREFLSLGPEESEDA